MATKMFKKYTESLTREWDVKAFRLPASSNPVPPDTVVVNTLSGEVGYTLTGTGDYVTTISLPGGASITGFPAGGKGNKPNGAVVAVDGTWLISVADTANGDTTLPSGATGRGTPSGTVVYQHNSTGAISLTSDSGTRIGVIDDGVIVENVAPVKIGV